VASESVKMWKIKERERERERERESIRKTFQNKIKGLGFESIPLSFENFSRF
jgi:hypothetical protein